MPKTIKRKNEKIINRKILNKVNDLHWKTIKHLTSFCSNILIGNMSDKQICSRKNKVLSASMKDLAMRMNYYQFGQRLE